MGEADGYRYVGFASRQLRGFRNRIAELGQVPEMVRACGGTDCFSSYYLFDGKLQEHLGSNGNSVAGFGGPVYARVVYMDIDAGELDKALTTARELVKFVTDRLGAEERSVFPYFSGSKGFHVGLHGGVFGGLEPGEKLPDVLRRVVGRLAAEAKVSYPDTVDFSVGRRLSLLRLPGTIHSGSGLYKTPLTLDELPSCDADGVRKLAGSPREIVMTDPSGLVPRYTVEPLPAAQDLFAACCEEAAQKRSCELPSPSCFLESSDITRALCDAELVLYHEGVPAGARSWTALRLASRMRCAGYREDDAVRMLGEWNARNQPPMEAPEVNRIVGVAYQAAEPYHFGCGTGQNDPPGTRLVYEACPYEKRSECRVYGGFREHVKEPMRVVRCLECEAQ